jgi:hypothetical protein
MNIFDAIRQDESDYIALCQHYNEPIHRKPDASGYPTPDCYGPHAKTLQARRRSLSPIAIKKILQPNRRKPFAP